MFDYAKKIREYRERKFISQQELAKILGVSNVTVCRWETGRYEPDMETKKKFSLEEFSEFTGFFRTIRFYQQGP